MYQVQLKRQGFTGSAQAGYANWIISIDTPFKGNACFKGEVLGIHTNCKLFECSGGFENCKQAIAQFLKIQFEPEEEAYMPPATNGDIFWTNIAYKPKNNSIVWLFSEDPLLSWQQDLFIDNTPLVDRTRIKIVSSLPQLYRCLIESALKSYCCSHLLTSGHNQKCGYRESQKDREWLTWLISQYLRDIPELRTSAVKVKTLILDV